MDSKKLVYGVGINDCKGWASYGNRTKDDLEYRIYNLWHHMLMRAYSLKFHEQCPTYRGVTVCERWHRLSTFAEDVVKIPNYELWKNNPFKNVCLDKDTLVKGNKEYSLGKCVFLTKRESSSDVFTRCQAATKTPEAKRKNALTKMKPVMCIHPDGTTKIYESMSDAERQGGFCRDYIRVCCLNPKRRHKGCEFKFVSSCF